MHRPRHSRCLLASAAASILAVSAPAPGQTSDDDIRRALQRRLERLDAEYRLTVPAGQPISERLLIDYGGSLRFGFITSDDQNGTTRVLRQSDATGHLRLELDGAHRFFGRLRLRYNDFNSGDSFDGRGDELDAPVADRYWYQFDLRGAELARSGQRLDWNLNIKAGRQYVQWGSGLALSNTLYAGLIDVELGSLGLEGLVGFTPGSETIDLDATREGFDTDTDRRYFGGRVHFRGLAQHRPSVGVLVQRDHNPDRPRTFRTPIGDVVARSRYDSEYFSIGSRGTLSPSWLYRVELDYETGTSLSSPINSNNGFFSAQSEEDIDAWAGVLTLTRLAHDDADTRLELELAGGSGDADRGHPSNTLPGNLGGTDDTAFNGLGYINTGLALSPSISNLLLLRGGAHTTIFDNRLGAGRMRASFDAFILAKADRDAPLTVSTTAERLVGIELDAGIDWRVSADVSVDLRYGIFLPGRAMPRGEDDPRHFLYLGVLYAF